LMRLRGGLHAGAAVAKMRPVTGWGMFARGRREEMPCIALLTCCDPRSATLT
jgi:hypothetical protein